MMAEGEEYEVGATDLEDAEESSRFTNERE